ncbi:hypothetical protein [Azospirillum palustre]
MPASGRTVTLDEALAIPANGVNAVQQKKPPSPP